MSCNFHLLFSVKENFVLLAGMRIACVAARGLAAINCGDTGHRCGSLGMSKYFVSRANTVPFTFACYSVYRHKTILDSENIVIEIQKQYPSSSPPFGSLKPELARIAQCGAGIMATAWLKEHSTYLSNYF